MEKKMFKLTNPQKNIWNMEFYYSDTNICNICGTGLIKEEINIDLLKKAINILVSKNDSFRIRLTLENNIPMQYFTDFEPFDIEVIKISSMEELRALENETVKEKFTLLNSPLFKFKLALFPDGYTAIVLNIHHIISDSWSMGIIINEIVKIYHSLINKTEYVSPTFSYMEFINSEEKYENSNKYVKDKEFWENYLSDFNNVVSIPSINKNNNIDNLRKAARATYFIDSDIMSKINAYCKAHKLSIYSFFMSIISIFVANSANVDDFAIGSPILNRTNFKDKNSTGMFISTIPFRAHVEPDISFLDFATKTSIDIMSIFRHQKYSYGNIIEDMRKKDDNMSNLYNISLSYQITRASEDANNYESSWAYNGTAIDELDINIYDLNDTGTLRIDYDYMLSKYSKEEIDAWNIRVLKIISQVVSNENIFVKDIEYLTDDEKDKILNKFNNRTLGCPLDSNIINLFENMVNKYPLETALIYKDKKYTYKELNSIVNKFAKYLSSKGTKNNDIICVYMDKTDWFIISILAIQKCDCAYLPMHPDYPEERVNYILNDSKSKILITDKDISFKNIDIVNPKKVDLQDFNDNNLNINILPDNLCYVIYTSGSTGKPKGVPITHKNLINFVYTFNDCFKNKFSNKDNCLSLTNISFDVSVSEIYTPLCFGATLVLYPENTLTDVKLLANTIEKNNITFLYIPPNVLDDVSTFIKSTNKKFNVNKMLVGVEAIKNNSLNNFIELNPNIEIVNGYGPSEATICSTFYIYKYNEDKNGTVPIGYPLKNNDIFILNFLGNLQPISFPGEICITGASVCNGYLNNPEKTKDAFTTISKLSQNLIYKTGDIGYWEKDGYISFIGRNDSQIKYRGHRIELNEINNNIKNIENITNSVTIFKSINDVPAICSYVSSSSPIITPDFVKSKLSEVLPYYMIPNHIIILDKLPLTPNGKIDRKNLPYINIEPAKYVKPSTLTEIKLHNILCSLLNVDKVSIYDDFFELGLDSLLAIRLSLDIYYEFKINLTVSDLFKNNTISKLALLIEKTEKEDLNNNEIFNITKAKEEPNYPLSSAQKRIYYASKIAGTSLLYNISGGIIIDKLLDLKTVQNIFNEIVKKHSVFRTYFTTYNGEVRQFVLDECKIYVKFYDDGIILEKDIQNIVNKFPKAFDLDFAPLLRVELHYINNSSLILIDTHHIIMDGTSLNILLKEFCNLYNNKEIGNLEIDYKDYSVWENNYLNSDNIIPIKEYWNNRFKNYEIPIINLPYDNPQTEKRTYNGKKEYFKIPENIFNNISNIAKKYGMSNYMVYLSVLYLLLYRYTGQENIIIGSPIEARYSSSLKDMIGMFVNNVVLNTTIDGKITLDKFLKETKKLVLDSLSNQPYPYDMLVKDLKIPQNTSLFDVVFAYQNENNNNLQQDDKIRLVNSDTKNAKFNLTIEIEPSTLNINFEYNTDLFEPQTIESIYEHYIYLLENITDNLNISLDDINIITEKENNLLALYNKTDCEINNDTVASIFEKVVLENKDNIAVICDNKTLTYWELNKKANSLAHHLISVGVKPNDIVAIMANRSLETIVCMLGILKAGAAFLNLDPTYPKDRTKYYLENSNAPYVLIQRELKDKIENGNNIIEIDLDNDIYTKNFDNPKVPVKPFDLSYVIYTSGSTGVPKGVLLHQVGFANMVKAMTLVLDYLKEGNKHCIASVTSTPFDIFVYEIFVSLTHGMKVLMANNSEHRNPVLLDALIKKYGADVMTVTPSLMKINYDNRLENSALSNIKHMVFGGEPLPEKFVQDLRALSPGVTIYNIYGPSEITVLSNVQNLNGEDKITIGPPILNTQIHILDKNKKRLPIGVVGEIYISGIQVGHGYLNKPDLTKKSFLVNPFGEGKMYKSGDIGRWTFDGKVQCLGRVDHQIKLRGLRIELGEIEAKIESIKGITASVINKIELDGREFLCGYYVCDKDKNVSENTVREFLRKSLPNYMIPTYFVKLKEMPYTINRKIDRKALPMPDLTKKQNISTNNEKLNTKQKKLLKIWTELLHNNDISIDDNFFDIGGDSILAINMQIEALKEGFKFEYADIFNFPTIRDLSAKITYKSGDILKDYDYSNINKLLKNNVIDNIDKIQKAEIGNVLLIGVTGYLGSHLIHSFLLNNSGDIYCLIRQKDNILPRKRLKNTLVHYFGDSFYQNYKNRIHVVEGDISKNNIGLSEEALNIIKKNVTTVINSGAIVKHFGQRDLFEKINVTGTKNVVQICKSFNKRLIHVSTISISGNGEKDETIIETPENINDKVIFSEKDLYVRQNLNNVYTVTKFEAEKIVLEEILNGLDAQIVRIGNITNRYSDGMFQRNVEENAFAKRLQSFVNIGVFPDYSLEHEIELTPVDLCADAILKIANYTSPCNVFHIYDTKLLPIKLLIDTLYEKGYKLLPVSNNEMRNIIDELLKDDSKKDLLSGIIHDLDKDKNLIYTSRIRLDCNFSEKYLNHLGFYWKPIDKDYLIKYINYFKQINFL